MSNQDNEQNKNKNVGGFKNCRNVAKGQSLLNAYTIDKKYSVNNKKGKLHMNNLLDEQIRILRNNMINAGMTKGLLAKETLLLSKSLNNLLNLKMIILKEKKSTQIVIIVFINTVETVKLFIK